MFAVIVTFTLKPGQAPQFLPLMLDNAQTSIAQEPGCHRFDVCTNAETPETLALYELYTDAAAFQAHLASDHFQTFDTATADMIADKQVQTYTEVRP